MSSFREGLSRFIPLNTLDIVDGYLEDKNLQLVVVNDRVTKLGDFRPMCRLRKYHKITINGGLNPYSFLLTLLHEVAHLYVFEQQGTLVNAHGKAWQQTFSELFSPILEQHLLPDDVHCALLNHFPHPKASSMSDFGLVQVLRKYDNQPDALILDELDLNDFFVFHGKMYQKIKKLRSYSICMRLSDKRSFKIHGLAEVQRSTPV
ncbi:MAG: SprT-like domain-containing protein [Bacteroidales bacterium]|nr:SprT-like domain-containing protein [Bacteroidales bacterium]